MKKLLESLEKINECPPMEGGAMPPAPMSQGTPVSMNVSLNASGKEHVADLINMMKNAGLGDAKPAADAMLPMRMDMERLSGIMNGPMDEPEMEEVDDEIEVEDGYANEPDPEYGDMSDAIPDGNDLNRKKKAYAAAQDGDNAMAVEAIKAQLMAALSEKKAKPDFLDMDKDGDKKEPMKKAIADKKKKAPVEEDQVDEISNNTLAGLALRKMQRDAEKKYRDSKGIKPSMADLAGKFDQETIAGLTRLKMQHDAEKKYRDSMRKKK